MHKRLLSLVAAAACAALAACNTPAGPMPVQSASVTASKHLYLALTSGAIESFALPLTSGSAPLATTTAASPGGMLATATQLFVAEQQSSTGNGIAVFALPLTANETPSFVIPNPGGGHFTDVKLDSNGNLWASSTTSTSCCVYEFTAPFSASSTPAVTINNLPSGGGYPWGLAFDSTGNLYLAGGSVNDKLSAPVSSSSTITTFGANYDNYGISVDSANRIYVANAASDGEIDVYPSSLGNTPVFTLTPSAGNYIGYPAFDTSGNYYVPVPDANSMFVYAPPLSASSAPALTFTATKPYSVTVGP